MKFNQVPRVRLIAFSSLHQANIQDFLEKEADSWNTDATSDAEKLSEFSGRICYQSFGNKQGRKTNKEYLEHILDSAHGSVLEHASFTFLFTGVSRSLTHELVRHRAGFGYSQLSQRYVDESETEFVVPDIIAEDPELFRIFEKAIESAQAAYIHLSKAITEKIDKERPDLTKTDKRKLARQAARSVLPNATETKIVVTANARAWRHFLELRGSEGAEPEIRKLAILVFKNLQHIAPNLFFDFQIAPCPNGGEMLINRFHKV
ncbi:MAG: FAD-dependent thymidylate synthase [bacterium]|nr:FAD-dependent thymidylate synthase [bacterium]